MMVMREKMLWKYVLQWLILVIWKYCLQDRLNRFITEMMEMPENCVTVERNSDDNIVVIRPEAKYILVNQDEKIHHSNDVQNR